MFRPAGFTPYKDTLVSECPRATVKIDLNLSLGAKTESTLFDEPTNGLDLLAKTADDSFAGLCSSPSSQYFYPSHDASFIEGQHRGGNSGGRFIVKNL